MTLVNLWPEASLSIDVWVKHDVLVKNWQIHIQTNWEPWKFTKQVYRVPDLPLAGISDWNCNFVCVLVGYPASTKSFIRYEQCDNTLV